MSLYAPGLFRWRLLPFGRLWYAEPNAVSNAIGYAIHYTRSHDVVIRVYDEAGNVIGFAGNGSFPVTFSVLPDVKRFLGPSVEQLLLKTVCTTLAA